MYACLREGAERVAFAGLFLLSPSPISWPAWAAAGTCIHDVTNVQTTLGARGGSRGGSKVRLATKVDARTT